MSVKSAERVLEIFDILAENQQGLTCKEISLKLGYAPSSTFELLKTMKENGYLLIKDNKKYFLGTMLIRLGNIVNNNLDFKNLIKPHLIEIMNILLETTFLGMVSKENIIYVDKVQSSHTVATNANIGSLKPIYCTGLGKIILAYMSKEERDATIENLDMIKFTNNTIVDKKIFKTKLDEFKKLGYAIDDEEIENGLWCLAVPLFDSNGKVQLAISVSGPKERMLEKKELIKKTMLKKSKEISELLGYIL
ncbi:IclR family transcriptional regulator [Fusobacterium sp. THCT1E2]